MKTIAIIGSRGFLDYEYFKYKLQFLISSITEDIHFVSGGAIGTDSLCRRFCAEENYKLIEHLPDYEKYSGKQAPLIRNKLIVADADMLIAFHNGTSPGTAFTIKLAEKKEIPLRIVKLTEDNKPIITV